MKNVPRRSVFFCLVVLAVFTSAAPASAVLTFGKFETGFLVPVAIYNPVEDTVIGINVKNVNPGSAIYWSFLGGDGTLYAHGSIQVTADRSDYSFSLAAADKGVHSELVGYLIFVPDDDGILLPSEKATNIGGHCFLVNPGNGDAALLPVVPLARTDLADIPLDLGTLNGASIVGLTYGQTEAARFECRYLIEPSLGANSRIVMWSLQDAPAQFTGRMRSVDSPVVADVILVAREKRVNVLSIQNDLAGRPEGFVEGSVTVDNPGSVGVCFVLVWSQVLHALQTLPAFEVD